MASSLSDILSTIQNGVIALNNLSIQVTGSLTNILSRFRSYESAWVSYTPTLTALVGVYTAATATGIYKVIGSVVHVHITINIVTVGAGTNPLFTLSVTPKNIIEVTFYGSERALTGFAVNGRVGSATQILLTYYDNTNPAANATTFEIASVYEAA